MLYANWIANIIVFFLPNSQEAFDTVFTKKKKLKIMFIHYEFTILVYCLWQGYSSICLCWTTASFQLYAGIIPQKLIFQAHFSCKIRISVENIHVNRIYQLFQHWIDEEHGRAGGEDSLLSLRQRRENAMRTIYMVWFMELDSNHKSIQTSVVGKKTHQSQR